MIFYGSTIDTLSFQGTPGWPDHLLISYINKPFNDVTATYSNMQYIIQVGLNDFSGIGGHGWAPMDDFVNLCTQYHLKTVWYCGFAGSVQGAGYPANIGITPSLIPKFFDNFMAATAARYGQSLTDFVYFNYCNEGTLGNPNVGLWQTGMGGGGSTGVDWIIKTGNIVRKYFPNAMIGVNDFRTESIGNDLPYGTYGTCPTSLPIALPLYRAMRSAGVLDWVGMEAHSPETIASANLAGALNEVAAMGAKIILTEFTPYSDGPWVPPENQSQVLAAWQRLLPIVVANSNVIGVNGPWGWKRTQGIYTKAYYLVDDTVATPLDMQVMTWLKTYIPTVIKAPSPPSPPPLPVPIPSLFETPAAYRVKTYPSMPVTGELSYKIGSFTQLVPAFLPDTVMIRPYGEYGMWTGGVYTKLSGGYWLNANSSLADPASGLMADIVYLVKNDLAILPTVKKVIIAVHWYSSLDQGNAAADQIVPAVGPEVQAWNWALPPPTEYSVYPWNRGNSYRLKQSHQVWPTLDDGTLISGIQYLQSMGYEVGLCPIVSLISNNYYYAGGGEWEIDRSNKNWTDPTAFTHYLSTYQYFYNHYIDLCAQQSIRPWIFYLGYAMRDITCGSNQAFVRQFVTMIHTLATYARSKLPNTFLTYAADLDEYYYSYLVRQNNCYLDPLWTIPELNYVGINWFAPLAANDTEDNNVLTQGVTQGEGDSYYLPGFAWRGLIWTDRAISNTTRNFKTGLSRTPINRLTSGVKDIVDWLSFYHYYPAISGVLAGCSPLPGIFPGDARLCAHMHGVGPVASLTAMSPTVGGIASVPDLKATWLQIGRHSFASLNFPGSIPDNSTLNFQFNFAIDSTLTNLTGTYRLFATSCGLTLDSIAGTITLWLLHTDGSYQKVPLFSAANGSIGLIYTPQSVKIYVDGTYDFTVSALGKSAFRMPAPMDLLWIGNPQPSWIPAGYGVWQGKIYFLSMVLGATAAVQSGGQYYFDDTYNGIRTAWNPGMKPWMATSFGYGSVHGSAADPQTRVETILGSGFGVPSWYSDYQNLASAIFFLNNKIGNIQGPYGSTFDPDQIYQAIVFNAAALGIIDAGAQHQVAWFFDTRSGGAYTFKAPNGYQIYNDAYDFEINSALNSKAAVRDSGTKTLYPEYLATVDAMLGLAIDPEFLPPQRSLLVQPGVPQK